MKLVLSLLLALAVLAGAFACSKSSSSGSSEPDYGALPSTISTGAL